MNILVTTIVAIALALSLPKPAHAIIFLPAIILIPIAKIVALVIGGLSMPALGIGAIWSNFSKKPLHKIVLVVVLILLVIAFILALVLKLHNPDRPFF